MPVITLESLPMSSWAKSVAGMGGKWMPGVVFQASPYEDVESETPQKSLSPEEQLRLFRATASPIAQRLAGYLAAVPLTLPIMRLVQQVMMPQTPQVYLAEVFLSGLIKRQNTDDSCLHSDIVRYDFIEGIRDILISSSLISETVNVISTVFNKVSAFIDKNTGKPLDFRALIADPSLAEQALFVKDRQTFAAVSSHVLRRLGGKYAELARVINVIYNQEYTKLIKKLKNIRHVFPKEVNVFTLDRKKLTLPKGSTPVDFAYHIHTEVGNRCTSAKVNGRIVPLRYELQTGDVVEIITTKGHHPSRDWMGFVKTVRAKNRIRQWIKAEDKIRAITLGREMCEKTFQKNRLDFNTIVKSEKMKVIIYQFGFKALDDLFASVGYGKMTSLQIVRKFLPAASNKIIRDTGKKNVANAGVRVAGVEDIPIRFGKCCQPLPGDEIAGYITLGGAGVTVHRINCANLLQMTQERLVDVQWIQSEKITFPMKIRIRSYDKIELMAELTKYIGKKGVQIITIKAEVCPDNTVDATITLAVRDTEELNRIISDIKNIKEIIEVAIIDS